MHLFCSVLTLNVLTIITSSNIGSPVALKVSLTRLKFRAPSVKIKVLDARASHGVGSMGPLKGPSGAQGKSTWWRSREQSFRKL